MRVTLSAYSILRELLPPNSGGKVEVEMKEEDTLRSLLKKFGIPMETACAVNGKIQRELDIPLREGDQVSVFRAGSGGNKRFNSK